jgi:hypothetical protein
MVARPCGITVRWSRSCCRRWGHAAMRSRWFGILADQSNLLSNTHTRTSTHTHRYTHSHPRSHTLTQTHDEHQTKPIDQVYRYRCDSASKRATKTKVGGSHDLGPRAVIVDAGRVLVQPHHNLVGVHLPLRPSIKQSSRYQTDLFLVNSVSG